MAIKNYFLLIILLGMSVLSFGQQSAKAIKILDKTAATFNKGSGIYIAFAGSQKGTLQLHGNKFHLLYGGIESWFDGKTQWSYVASNEEVTITNPTIEEMQETNPYSIFSTYKSSFNCHYKGIKKIHGKNMHEIILTPQKDGTNIKNITLHISESFIPQDIILHMQVGKSYSFIISSYLDGKKYDSGTFRFDSRKHPQAEIIDLR